MPTPQQQAYDSAVYQQAISMGIPDAVAKNIVAQARHESADYTSHVFSLTNNAFGYKYVVGAHWQTGAGPQSSEYHLDASSYAKYKNIQDSTGELVDWLKRRDGKSLNINSLTTPDAYAHALKENGYYGDTLSNYTNGLIAASSRIDWQTVGVVTGAGAGLLLVVLALFFFITKK